MSSTSPSTGPYSSYDTIGIYPGKIDRLPRPLDEREKIDELVQSVNTLTDLYQQLYKDFIPMITVIEKLRKCEALKAMVNLEEHEDTTLDSMTSTSLSTSSSVSSSIGPVISKLSNNTKSYKHPKRSKNP